MVDGLDERREYRPTLAVGRQDVASVAPPVGRRLDRDCLSVPSAELGGLDGHVPGEPLGRRGAVPLIVRVRRLATLQPTEGMVPGWQVG